MAPEVAVTVMFEVPVGVGATVGAAVLEQPAMSTNGAERIRIAARSRSGFDDPG
jgi:hypothetical protein